MNRRMNMKYELRLGTRTPIALPSIYLRLGEYGLITSIGIYDDCSVLHINGDGSGTILRENRTDRTLASLTDVELGEIPYLRCLKREQGYDFHELLELRILEQRFRENYNHRTGGWYPSSCAAR